MKKEQNVILVLKALSNQLVRYMGNIKKSLATEIGKMDDLTEMHAWIIRFIVQHQDHRVFQQDIENEFGIRPSTTSRILRLMQKHGLIKRDYTEDDARIKTVTLTKKALDINATIDASLQKGEADITKGVSKSDLAAFFRVIETISRNIQ